MFVPILLLACADPPGSATDVATAPPKAVSAVPAELLDSAWQVRMAVDAARAPFEGRPGWVAYFTKDRAAALQAFAEEKDAVGLARLHAEYAAMYRQAALMAAHATAQVYGADAQPTDPKETSYLLGVSAVFLGDATRRARIGESAASSVKQLATVDAGWKKWLEAGAVWPPDAPSAASPNGLAGATAGQTPAAGAVPHYELPEQGEGGLKVQAGDPGSMWALSRWHEAAAVEAAPESSAAVSLLIDPWRLPPELGDGAPAPVGWAYPDAFLFMSALSTAGDAAFFADLSRVGASAVALHAAESPYARIVQSCTEASKLSVDCVLDQSAAFGDAIEARMEAKAGRVDSFHRFFAGYARVGVLRAGDRAAAAMGDGEASGRLRINALDRTTGATRDPIFLLSVAAWDASNRNSVRAEELVHGLLTEVPGLEAARLPLDALHIRLSRNAAPGRPMH